MRTPNPIAFLALGLLATSLAAQRGESTLKCGAYECGVSYGQPVWGKRSIDDLQVGQSWRLGMNQASTWQTQMPLLQGSTLIAPGSYRVGLQRTTDADFALEFASAALAVGGSGSANLAGKLAKDEVAKKLLIELAKGDSKGAAKPAADADLPARVRVRFGPHRIEGDFTMISGRELGNTGKFKLVGWSLPQKVVEDALAAGQSVTVASYFPTKKLGNKDPEVFNIVVSSKGADLIPGLLMPEEQFGFGEVAAPLPAWKQTGEITWTDVDQGPARLEFGTGKLERKDKRYSLELRCGKKTATLKIGEPEQAKG